MGNLDVLEYRVDRLEKAQDQQLAILTNVKDTVDKFIKDQDLKNQARDIKIRNIMLVGSGIVAVLYQIGIDILKKFIGV